MVRLIHRELGGHVRNNSPMKYSACAEAAQVDANDDRNETGRPLVSA
jgi:hypothetical protein